MSLRFAGYAALFDLLDGSRDIIRPGAFSATLAQRTSPLPIYWQHRPDQSIGIVEHAAEDARGLRVIARIDNPESRSASLVRTGAVSGLSFGYRVRRAEHGVTGRVIEALDLFEISLVTHPLQHGARVHLVS